MLADNNNYYHYYYFSSLRLSGSRQSEVLHVQLSRYNPFASPLLFYLKLSSIFSILLCTEDHPESAQMKALG